MSAKGQNSEREAVVCRTEERDCDDLDLKLSKSWLRIGIAGVFAGQGMVFSLALNMTPPPYGSAPYWVLHGGLIFTSLVVMAFLGGPLFASTFGMLRTKRISIEGLFTLSLLGAFIGSVTGSLTGAGNVYYEIVSIVIAIYTFGRMLSERSQAKMLLETDRVRQELETARLVCPDGGMQELGVEKLRPGDRVRVDPGEAFTLDGRVVEGLGYVRETALTGEPLPVVRRQGDRVRAGTYSLDGSFQVEVESSYGEREIDRILRTVEDHGGKPSELQAQANRLTQYFLPIVASVSLGTALYWSLVGGWQAAVFNSMAVLLVACPCALGLATPVAIWHGLYRLSRMGLISRDGALIDTLAATRHVFFDKTGTLSESGMQVVECVLSKEWEARRSQLFAAVIALESRFSHPVAEGIRRYCRQDAGPEIDLKEVALHPGKGVSAIFVEGGEARELQLGEFVADTATGEGLEAILHSDAGKRVPLYCNGRLVAIFVLRESLRAGVSTIWQDLWQMGVRCSILTGDPRPDPTLSWPVEVEVAAGLSAESKYRRVKDAVEAGERPLFVGDGINDTAAMAAAGASVSMGSGVPLARSAATAQLLNDRIEVLGEAIRLARNIHKRLRGNLIYAATYNVIGMFLAAVGWLHPVAAALIMLISSFFVTVRALGRRGETARHDIQPAYRD